MSPVRIVWEVVIALLSIIGVYAVLREVVDGWLCSRQITVAVLLQEAADDTELDILLSEARRHRAYRRGERAVLLIPEAFLQGPMGKDGHLSPPLAAIAARYRAEVYCLGERVAQPDDE